MQLTHPNNSRIVFEVEELPEYKGAFDKYSPIEPDEKGGYEITAVAFDGTDITDFVLDFCDDLIPEWEEKLWREKAGLD